MIQKPTLRDGKCQPKGHWFICSEVAKGGTIVEDWKFSKADIEASMNKGCDVEINRSSKESSPSKRTMSRKRGLLASSGSCDSLVDLDTKRVRDYGEVDSGADEESDSDDYDMAEETVREQKLIIRNTIPPIVEKCV